MEGLPIEIMAQLREFAAAEWPDDFEMQKDTLVKQAEAYRDLKEIKSSADSDPHLRRILTAAQGDWPKDYEMLSACKQKCRVQ